MTSANADKFSKFFQWDIPTEIEKAFYAPVADLDFHITTAALLHYIMNLSVTFTEM